MRNAGRRWQQRAQQRISEVKKIVKKKQHLGQLYWVFKFQHSVLFKGRGWLLQITCMIILTPAPVCVWGRCLETPRVFIEAPKNGGALTFWFGQGKLRQKHLNHCKQVNGDEKMSRSRFLVVQDVSKWDARAWKMTLRSGSLFGWLTDSTSRSSADCSVDRKWAGTGPGQVLEDHHNIWTRGKSGQRWCRDGWTTVRWIDACRCVRCPFACACKCAHFLQWKRPASSSPKKARQSRSSRDLFWRHEWHKKAATMEVGTREGPAITILGFYASMTEKNVKVGSTAGLLLIIKVYGDEMMSSY